MIQLVWRLVVRWYWRRRVELENATARRRSLDRLPRPCSFPGCDTIGPHPLHDVDLDG